MATGLIGGAITRIDLAAASGTDRAPRFTGIDAALLLLVALWGVNFTIIKVALADLDVLAFSVLRFGVASTLLALVVVARGSTLAVARRDLVPVLGLGLVGHTIYQALFVSGLRDSQAGQSALVLSLVPVFVAMMGRALGIEVLRPMSWIGVLVSFAGVALLVLAGPTPAATISGDLRTLASAVAWAIYTVFSKPLLERYSPLQLTATTMMAGFMGLVVIGLPSVLRQPWGAVSATAWAAVAYSTVGGLVIAYVIWFAGVHRLGGTRTAVYSNLVPVVALAVGWLVLAERLNVWQLAGAAAVIVGVALARRRQ